MDRERIDIESIPVIPKEGELGVKVNRVKTSMYYMKGRGYYLSICPCQVKENGRDEEFIVTSMAGRHIESANRFSRKELERLAGSIHTSPIYQVLVEEVLEKEKLQRLLEKKEVA